MRAAVLGPDAAALGIWWLGLPWGSLLLIFGCVPWLVEASLIWFGLWSVSWYCIHDVSWVMLGDINSAALELQQVSGSPLICNRFVAGSYCWWCLLVGFLGWWLLRVLPVEWSWVKVVEAAWGLVLQILGSFITSWLHLLEMDIRWSRDTVLDIGIVFRRSISTKVLDKCES
ncbi:hypothetical protein U1Q18_021195 [Sarracenia purpurea var. burkii]